MTGQHEPLCQNIHTYKQNMPTFTLNKNRVYQGELAINLF